MIKIDDLYDLYVHVTTIGGDSFTGKLLTPTDGTYITLVRDNAGQVEYEYRILLSAICSVSLDATQL